MKPYKIAIIGGGLMGATLASFLAPSQAEIYVLDKQSRAKSYQTTHVIALSAGASACYSHWLKRDIFEKIATKIHRVETTQSRGVGKIVFNAQDLNVEYLGLVIDASSLLQSLHQSLGSNCHWLESAECHVVQSSESGVEIQYAVDNSTDYQTLQVDLCLIADGMQSPLTKQLGFGAQVHSYHQHAIVGQCTVALPHKGTAYERFLKTGAIALLPFGHDAFWYVVISDDGMTPTWMSMEDSDFLSYLNEQTAYRAGVITAVNSRHAVPLTQSLAQAVIANRCLVMGNAAHSLHPLAAQGFNLSVLDAHHLALLFQGFSQPSGNTQALLQTYEQRVAIYQKTIIHAVHGLAVMGTHEWLSPLKSLGLSCLGYLPTVQESIVEWSLGRY